MNNREQKVSIIIRTFNEQYWIPKLLKKIKEQTYTNYDIVLVDNFSNDKTVEIFYNFFPKSKVVNLKVFNPGKAINLGIKETDSDLIVIISAHCVPKNRFWLKKLVSNMKSDDVVACYGRQIPLSTSASNDKRDLLNTFGVEKRVQKKDSFFHNANSIIKKSFWKKFPFDESFDHIEDRVWAKKVIKEKKFIIYEPDACVYHYHGINHSSNDLRARKISEILTKYTLGSSNKIPSFMEFMQSKTLYCILGHNIKTKEIFKETIKSIKSLNNDKLILVYSDIKHIKNSKDKENLMFIKKQRNYESLSFIKILKMLLSKSYKNNYYPDCINYINLNNEKLKPKKINESVKHFYNNMFDTVFYGHSEYNQIWMEKDDSFLAIKDDYDAPKGQKTPYYIAEYGMGTATKPELIDKNKLVGKKIGIININNVTSF